MSESERTTRAMTKGEFTIFDLALPALAPELFHCLNHQEKSQHTRMIRRQASPIGINRELPPQADTTVCTYEPPSPFPQKPRLSRVIHTVMVKES